MSRTSVHDEIRGVMVRQVVAVLILAATLAPTGSAMARSWQELFAAETDTVVFFSKDGALIRAPFHLALRETLWVPAPGQYLCRYRVSPDGSRVAWITRASDDDTTRLWIAGARPPRPRVRYFSIEPRLFGQVYFEQAGPTLADPHAHGARLVAPNPLTLRPTSTAIEWLPEGSRVVFGTTDGLAVIATDSGEAAEVSPALVVDLKRLEPASIYLANAILMSEGQRREGWYLVYPGGDRWHFFSASGLDPNTPWTASENSVWWAKGKTIRAVHAHTPVPSVEVESPSPIAWLGFDQARRDLVWASGHDLYRRAEDGRKNRVLALRSDISDVLEVPRGATKGLVTTDSLVVWNPLEDRIHTVALAGATPIALFEGPQGEILVATRRLHSKAPGLARAEQGRFVAIETPEVRNGIMVASPGGRWLLLYKPGARAADKLWAFDVAGGAWTEIANPGVAGWEVSAPN